MLLSKLLFNQNFGIVVNFGKRVIGVQKWSASSKLISVDLKASIWACPGGQPVNYNTFSKLVE